MLVLVNWIFKVLKNIGRENKIGNYIKVFKVM